MWVWRKHHNGWAASPIPWPLLFYSKYYIKAKSQISFWHIKPKKEFMLWIEWPMNSLQNGNLNSDRWWSFLTFCILRPLHPGLSSDQLSSGQAVTFRLQASVRHGCQWNHGTEQIIRRLAVPSSDAPNVIRIKPQYRVKQSSIDTFSSTSQNPGMKSKTVEKVILKVKVC